MVCRVSFLWFMVFVASKTLVCVVLLGAMAWRSVAVGHARMPAATGDSRYRKIALYKPVFGMLIFASFIKIRTVSMKGR